MINKRLIGAAAPMLPAFPFLMLAAFCFGVKTLSAQQE